MLSLLRFVSSHALAALAEPRCAGCDLSVPRETVFCRPCASTLVARYDSPVVHATHLEVAAFEYGGALRDTIARFKYGRRDDLARPLGALLSRAKPRVAAARPDVVVPVPSHPVRLALRTFDPAALLAGSLADTLGVPLVVDALDKIRVTQAQAGLDRRARIGNLEGAFAARSARAHVLRNTRVALVDDVRTTGATLAACRAALVACGANVVVEVVLASAVL